MSCIVPIIMCNYVYIHCTVSSLLYVPLYNNNNNNNNNNNKNYKLTLVLMLWTLDTHLNIAIASYICACELYMQNYLSKVVCL